LRRQHIIANIEAHNARRARTGAQKTGNHFHGGGFTRPIRPQKTHDLTALNPKRQVSHGGEITEFFDEMIDFNHVVILNEPPSP
jgi:hypothetical protein